MKTGMTKGEALKGAVKEWEWLAQTGGRKEEYFHNFKIDNIPSDGCYLCGYNDAIEKNNCKHCPAETWAANAPEGNLPCSPCYNAGSPYKEWATAKDSEERKKAAEKMVEFLKKEFAALEEKEEEEE